MLSEKKITAIEETLAGYWEGGDVDIGTLADCVNELLADRAEWKARVERLEKILAEHDRIGCYPRPSIEQGQTNPPQADSGEEKNQ